MDIRFKVLENLKEIKYMKFDELTKRLLLITQDQISVY